MKYLSHEQKSNKLWKRLLIIIPLTFIGFYIVFMGLYFATSEPSFCASCHELKPYVSTWQQHPHKEVKCLFCHEMRGFVGKLHSKSRGINYLYQQWTGQYTIITEGQVFEQNCIACHLGEQPNYPNAKRLDSKHYVYIKQDKSCLMCHRTTGHQVNIFSKQKFK